MACAASGLKAEDGTKNCAPPWAEIHRAVCACFVGSADASLHHRPAAAQALIAGSGYDRRPDAHSCWRPTSEGVAPQAMRAASAGAARLSVLANPRDVRAGAVANGWIIIHAMLPTKPRGALDG